MHKYFDDTQLVIISQLKVKFEREKKLALEELEIEHIKLLDQIAAFHESMGINAILCDNCDRFEMDDFTHICFRCYSAVCETCNE